MAKPVRLRSLATDDIDAIVDHYGREAGGAVAARFIDALERALTHIATYPHSGSLRFAYELDIPDLRAVPLARFPYILFYLDAVDQIDIWRVHHTRPDLPTAFADPNDA